MVQYGATSFLVACAILCAMALIVFVLILIAGNNIVRITGHALNEYLKKKLKLNKWYCSWSWSTGWPAPTHVLASQERRARVWRPSGRMRRRFGNHVPQDRNVAFDTMHPIVMLRTEARSCVTIIFIWSDPPKNWLKDRDPSKKIPLWILPTTPYLFCCFFF